MRPALLVLALAVASAGCGQPASTPPDPAPLTVMTYNVMCSFCQPPGFDDWATRVPHLDEAINRHDPDLLAIEELFYQSEVDTFRDDHPGYTAIYYIDPGTPNAPFKLYPDATIFYRTSRFTEVRHGVFWLSPTPDTPWTGGFAQNQLWRLFVWAELVDKPSGKHLVFAATHFDNNAPSQEKSAPLVVDRMTPLAKKMPVIVAGDFNSTPSTTAYKTLAAAFENTYDLAKTPRIDTNQDPVPTWDPSTRIDHIWTDGHTFTVPDWAVDIHAYGNPAKYPSDHFAIAAKLDW